MIVAFFEQVGHINSIWIMVLAEAQAGSGGQPGYELVTGATLDFIGARHELRLSHIHNHSHS